MDRNFDAMQIVIVIVQSLSARRAWIEISMDDLEPSTTRVALRKESVDRNMPRKNLVNSVGLVALRKESVDRNYIIKITGTAPRRSLSARRAWIEIGNSCTQAEPEKSLSARRAWIEI